MRSLERVLYDIRVYATASESNFTTVRYGFLFYFMTV